MQHELVLTLIPQSCVDASGTGYAARHIVVPLLALARNLENIRCEHDNCASWGAVRLQQNMRLLFVGRYYKDYTIPATPVTSLASSLATLPVRSTPNQT
jgi:hypothetical protein